MQIVIAQNGQSAYALAGEAFQQLYKAVTGQTVEIVSAASAADGDLVVIGGSDVNAFADKALLEGWGPAVSLPVGSDAYAMESVQQNNRNVLFLWGGRGRSTLYAVYAFFEKRAGCRYFWDGDVIPCLAQLSLSGLCECKQPDFALRGLRYFAHRGLHRFQAEHWSLADWKKEIDWIVKRRLNMFMLRIGADDLFQKAFPDIVSYPDAHGILPEAGSGYDERTLFWPLQYRGELRQQVLAYAFARDLIHPEDCGTTTHWYTRTPLDFLAKVKPQFMPQVTDVYRQPTGLVWDVRQDRNLDNYFALTKAHIREYGRAQLFHTIGLAERMCSADRTENMRYKKMAYRRILSKVEQEWPGSPVLIASWDFAMHWQPQEVQAILAEFDPARHLIFDYTADTKDPVNNFTNWGFYKKFPWVFGIFHAFEPSSDVRGDYAVLSRRLAMARDDTFCRGLVFWPELSHSDTLMLEYFSKSAWTKVDDRFFIEIFCRDRYGTDADAMLAAWRYMEPLLSKRVWELDREAAIEDIHQEYFFDVLGYRPLRTCPAANLARWHKTIDGLPELALDCAKVLQALVPLYAGEQSDFVRRDCADLARSALGRILNDLLTHLICLAAQQCWRQTLTDAYLSLLHTLCDVLDGHEDYSQFVSLQKLQAVHGVNPLFENTLKQNLANSYCRGYASEFMRYLCVPENEAFLHWLNAGVQAGVQQDEQKLLAQKEALYRRYMDTPLAQMAPQKPLDLHDRLARVSRLLVDLSVQLQKGEHE